MAFANFFNKTALGAAQILQGFDLQAFTATLESHVVAIAFDVAAARSPEGRTTLDLSINLLSRLYPRLALCAQDSGAEPLLSSLSTIARSINPNIEIQQDWEGVTACLVVGNASVTTSSPVIYIGSEGWVTRLSAHGPVGSGASDNPFGASAAACFGAANIFRLLFGERLSRGEPDRSFSMSLIDMNPNADAAATDFFNPVWDTVDLGDTCLVGVGAIGNGTLWVLARLPRLCGTLHLVDAEDIDLTNLQRYALTTQQSIGRSKVQHAAHMLRDTGLEVHPHQRTWGDYLRVRNDFRLPQVAVAVDSAEDRMAIQAALPQWIVNAWTQLGDLGVSRHSFLGEQACLMCLYLPDDAQKSEDEIIAEGIGLPDTKREVRKLLHTGEPVGRAWIERIAAARGIPVEPLLLFESQPLRTFYTAAICGGLVVHLGGSGNQESHATVPMAFQSTFAGILLAAELVAQAGKLRRSPVSTVTRLDLLKPLPISPYLSQPHAKHPLNRCICQDIDYIAAFRDKYAGLS